MDSALVNSENDKPIWAIVVVNNLDPVAGDVDYTIRMNFTTVPGTMKAVHKRHKALRSYYKRYYTSGFLSLQVCSSRVSIRFCRGFSILDLMSGSLILLMFAGCRDSYVFTLTPKSAAADLLSENLMWAAPFPVPAHTRNRFYQAVSLTLFFIKEQVWGLKGEFLNILVTILIISLRWLEELTSIFVLFQVGPMLGLLMCLTTLYPLGMLVKVS